MTSEIRHPVLRVVDGHVVRPHPALGLEFLLLRRAPGALYAGSWRMVAGKIGPGEAAWQACRREVAEETGLTVERLWVVPFVNRFYEWEHDRLNDIPVFVAQVGPGEPRLDKEHDAWAWVDLAEAKRRMLWPGQRDGAQAAFDLLVRDHDLRAGLEVRATAQRGSPERR